MKLSLHEHQHSMSLKIKCNIDHMKSQYKTMYWKRWFQPLFHSFIAYMAILETSTWNPPLELASLKQRLDEIVKIFHNKTNTFMEY